MQSAELVEMAALLSSHGASLIRAGGPLPTESLEQYWSASKARQDRWSRTLKRHSVAANGAADGESTQAHWPQTRAVVEEILSGELLTRVWTAVLTRHDRCRRCQEAEPVARSVLVGHLEARRRALDLIVQTSSAPVDEAVPLNRLRRRCERWCDLLLANLQLDDDVTEFAFDATRVLDFATDMRDQRSMEGDAKVPSRAWSLTLISLRAAFGGGALHDSPNADINARIAAGILGCFPSELFDSFGQAQSLWMVRLSSAASDMQGLVDELLDFGPLSGRRVFGARRFS